MGEKVQGQKFPPYFSESRNSDSIGCFWSMFKILPKKGTPGGCGIGNDIERRYQRVKLHEGKE